MPLGIGLSQNLSDQIISGKCFSFNLEFIVCFPSINLLVSFLFLCPQNLGKKLASLMLIIDVFDLSLPFYESLSPFSTISSQNNGHISQWLSKNQMNTKNMETKEEAMSYNVGDS